MDKMMEDKIKYTVITPKMASDMILANPALFAFACRIANRDKR